MPQSEFVPKSFSESASNGTGTAASTSLHLQSQATNGRSSHSFSFEVVKNNLFRVTFSSDKLPLPPFPSVERPATEVQASTVTVSTASDATQSSKAFVVGGITAEVNWSDTPIVSLKWTDSDEILHTDLPSRSYVQDGNGVAHYTRHDRNALHVGLGEKAAPMDLTSRHFYLDATDCFGYNAYATDPMYKNIPLLIKATPTGVVAMFSTSHARGRWAVGSEIDGLWGHFKVYRQDFGGLEEYLIVGKTLREVVTSYAELVGMPLLCPRWAYGYVSGGYRYTMMDSPPAHQYMLEFADKLVEHDMPCGAHQMSSGWSIAHEEPKVRNVFHWNKYRFPDPEGWIAEYRKRGIALIPNIKPFILKSHPEYKMLADAGALFTEPGSTEPATMMLWSAGGGEGGLGSHIDYTNPVAFKWWFDGCKMLAEQGMCGLWNDNNEYTLPNDEWQMTLTGLEKAETKVKSVPNSVGLWGRAMQTELMAKASHDALISVRPRERPYVLTRSATAGTMRYAASTWSGDNMTSWDAMKAANSISITGGISLLQCYGEDVGGFEGPQPSPELLLRWIQLAIHSSRFAINCFKTSPDDNQCGEVIEPWMYPHIIPQVRKVLKRRYELLPYTYSLALESHLFASPPRRWIGWGYESDPEVWTPFLKRGEEQFWFGDSILVGGVYVPGVSTARVYLPRKSADDFGYINLNAPYDYLSSGQWVDIASKWEDSIPLLAKIGGAVPIGKEVVTRAPGSTEDSRTLPADDWRGLEIFPPKGSLHGALLSTTWYEDDGISASEINQISTFKVEYSATEEKVEVAVRAAGDNKYTPEWQDLDIILPMNDQRFVVSSKTGVVLEKIDDHKGRAAWRFKAADLASF